MRPSPWRREKKTSRRRYRAREREGKLFLSSLLSLFVSRNTRCVSVIPSRCWSRHVVTLSPSNSRKKVTNFTLASFSSVCVQDCRPLLQQPPHALVSLSYFVPQTKSVQIFQTLFSCRHCLDTRTHDIWELHLSKRDVLETLKRIGRLRQGYQSCSPIRWGRFVIRKEVCPV